MNALPRIPTAAPAPASMTRAQVTDALAQLPTADDEPLILSHWADRCFSEPANQQRASADGRAL